MILILTTLADNKSIHRVVFPIYCTGEKLNTIKHGRKELREHFQSSNNNIGFCINLFRYRYFCISKSVLVEFFFIELVPVPASSEYLNEYICSEPSNILSEQSASTVPRAPFCLPFFMQEEEVSFFLS